MRNPEQTHCTINQHPASPNNPPSSPETKVLPAGKPAQAGARMTALLMGPEALLVIRLKVGFLMLGSTDMMVVTKLESVGVPPRNLSPLLWAVVGTPTRKWA